MELHLVHWNTRYGNPPDALKKGDGLGVLGLLFDVSNQARDFQDSDLLVTIQTHYLLFQFFGLHIKPT